MRLLLVLSSLLLATAPAADDIKVERHKRPGADLIKADMDVSADMKSLLAALETPCAVRQWLPRTREVRILESRPDNVRLVRMVTHFPWPWHNRVAVLEFHRSQPQPDTIAIEMQAVQEGSVPAGLVRVGQSSGHWLLRQRTGHIHVQYRQRFNPSGTVPQWLADKVAAEQVRHALENIRKMVEQPTRDTDGCHWHPAGINPDPVGDGQSAHPD